MIITRSDSNGNDNNIADVIQSDGNLSYIKDGIIHKNVPLKSVMITSQSELSILTDYEPGTIAYTAGFASMWQLSADGTWISI